jgi:FtsP/CotA-like multicopper oxidase with cupredoxin domain
VIGKLVATALIALFSMAAIAPGAAHAGEDPCRALDRLYPEPGRYGFPGDNAFRPLPVLAPERSAAGAPGTISMSIAADHVSQATAGAPGYVYVGNYPVTNIPVFRVRHGAATSFDVVQPEDGRTLAMSDDCIASPDWGFGGTQWALVQGDTLDVLFHSRLDYDSNTQLPEPTNGAVPCDSSNLHTHGLLVSSYHPAKPGTGPQGDYVLDVTQPRSEADRQSGTDSCGTELGTTESHHHGITSLPLHYVTDIPGKPGQSGLKSGEHPSGLYWYHPHPHGFSRIQVHGGTTGAITIGALTDYACPTGDGVPGNCTLTNTNVRVMALKDTEIQSYGAGGLWESVVDPESSFCTNTGGTRHGECQASEKGEPGKWVFTINGVQYPTIHPGAGKMEIWRIINASNGLSYVLSLDSTAADGTRTQLPFQVLANDGVSIQQGSNQPFMRTQIMMLPSSRVEIAIPAPPGGGTFILHNQAVETGNKGSGDIWPDVDLARVVWEKTSGDATQGAASAVAVAAPDTPAPEATADETKLPLPCRFAKGDTRVIYFVHRFNTVGTVTKEIFGLIAGIRHADGRMDFFDSDQPGLVLHDVKKVWAAGVAGEDGADASFPGFMHNPWSKVCTVKGSVEPWELQNWTAEDHNFHIHQSKFTINPNGVFEYPVPETIYHKDLLLGDALVKAFADPTAPLAYFDNMPVPRGQSFCDVDRHDPGCHRQSPTDNLECTGEPEAVRCANPGKTSLMLDFSRYEQVGTYVYHCHILEHEDGGMMAQITVLCPPGDTKCAAEQTASAPICRPGDQESGVGQVLDAALKSTH